MIDRNVIQILNRAVEYFEENLTRPALVEKAAIQVGYSRYHFSRLFSSVTGLTPFDYLRKRRLSAAAYELAHSSKSIIEVAFEYQFQSHEAFSRSFKREFGISPKRYRLNGKHRHAFGRITLGATRLLYPGNGIAAKPAILIPEPPPLTANLLLNLKDMSQMSTLHTTTRSAGDSIRIRPAERQDIPALCRLYHFLHEFTVQGVPDRLRTLGEFEHFDAAELSHSLEKLLDTVDTVILVAESAGDVIGLAELYLRMDEASPLRISYRFGYLQSLVVASHWRNRGVGKKLLQAAESWCREKGASELRLDAWEFESGPFQFYANNGYRTLRCTLVRTL